ncbi:hypothetical protein CC80DRAFT_591353 [Byssothecium circinans]|uniref:Uncharacterized protein n=1 Tax=Byssothecium circinans TaxID=147558 RepID=A0A6A5U357_9PLEO|nr:hypothetical protein CC80DRAFT_591353 [Byssothecium circinans]
MPPRSMCPSMGAMRRPVSRDVAALSNCCARGFHASTRQLQDQSGNGSSSGDPSMGPTRRIRNATAANQLSSLQNRSRTTSLQGRRPLPRNATLAGGSFRGGIVQEGDYDASNPSSSSAPPGAKILTPRKPLVSKVALGRSLGDGGGAATAGPPGTMVRAPTNLRITRNARGPTGPRGPNLRGRGPSSSSQGGRERGPKKREGGKPGSGGGQGSGANLARMMEDAKPEQYISDGMLQHMLRLQRKEWDRVPYEPKYAEGSLAANELVHIGRELFKGDVPDVPVWGRLEKTVGIVGMHGAADRLRVRRVVDRAEGNARQARMNYVIEEETEGKTREQAN